MLHNFVKVIFRYLSRSKFFTALNIAGLSVGMACCIVIYLFVSNELSYDRFHADGENIYRVIRQSQINGMPYNIGITSKPFAEALRQDYGDKIKSTTRAMAFYGLAKYEDKAFIEEKIQVVDNNFFEFFSYPLLKGEASTVFAQPNSIVISKSFAAKYFGNDEPIGKVIRIDDMYDVQVSGIIDEIPGNTHLQFEALIPLALVQSNEEWMNDWWANAFNTYVKVEPRDADYLKRNFPQFMDKYFGKDFERVGNKIGLTLEPLHEIYFNYDTRYENQIKHGDKRYVLVFTSVGILLILLAAINYINLATAQASERAKEVGIRKTLGSSKRNIAAQFLSESFFLCVLSLVIGLAVAQASIPLLNAGFGLSISGKLNDPYLWSFIVVLLVVIAVASGGYPSFLLASFQPVKVLKGEVKGNMQYLLIRKALVVFQFCISAFMIIATLFIGQQLKFMNEKDLGFQPDQLVVVTLNNGEINRHRNDFKERLLRETGFLEATYTSGHPGGFYDATTVNVEGVEQNQRMRTLHADWNLVNTMGLTMAAGRFFSHDTPADSIASVVLNETAVRQLGWQNDEAIGKRVLLAQFDSVYKEVVGVIKDYHFSSLKERIEPLVISCVNMDGGLMLKISGGDIPGAIANLEKVWNSYDTGFPLQFEFVDEAINRHYTSEAAQGRLFTIFSVISVAIACLGILGLASYVAAQRRKEIGIRKVLGATSKEVSILLMSDLFKLILVANLIAIPLGYWAVEKWSEDFAYRVPLGPTIFIIGVLTVFLIAMIIVGLNAMKVAMQNPVKSLRTE